MFWILKITVFVFFFKLMFWNKRSCFSYSMLGVQVKVVHAELTLVVVLRGEVRPLSDPRA